MTNPTAAVLVVCVGIGGIRQSLDVATAGLDAYPLNKSLAIDETLAQSGKILPTNGYTMCIPSPKPMKCELRRVSWPVLKAGQRGS